MAVLRNLVVLASAFACNALRVAPVAPQSTSRAAVSMMAKIPNKMKWVPFVNAGDCQKGTINSGFQYGLEIAIVCDPAGKLYATSNKMPPFGQPTTFADLEKGAIVDPVTGTKFSLSNGKPQGTWCPKPPGISKIFQLLTSPATMPVYPVRKSGNAVEVNVNVNAKAQFESGYWRGILDAQGKTDGAYY